MKISLHHWAILSATCVLSACQLNDGLIVHPNTGSKPAQTIYHPTLSSPTTYRMTPEETARWLGNFNWQRQWSGSKAPVTLTFETAMQTVRLQGECNQLFGSYQQRMQKDQLTITINQMGATRRACSPELMRQDDEVINALSQQRFEVNLIPDAKASRLQLKASNGQIFEFIGQPTDEMRYSGQAQIVFLEVAPNKVRCQPQHTAQCLQVRQIQYDTQGLKTNVGPWFVLQQEIEHYQHHGRAVVRTKKFTTKQPQTTPEVYVLDAIVEQSTL